MVCQVEGTGGAGQGLSQTFAGDLLPQSLFDEFASRALARETVDRLDKGARQHDVGSNGFLHNGGSGPTHLIKW